MLVAIYVDDTFIFGSKSSVAAAKEMLRQEFQTVDSGPISFGLGVQFVQFEGGYAWHQEKYILEMKIVRVLNVS